MASLTKMRASKTVSAINRLVCSLCGRDRILSTIRPFSTARGPSKSDGDKASETERSKKDGRKSWKESFTGKNAWKLSFGSLGLMTVVTGGIVINEWGAPRRDQDGNEIHDIFSDFHPVKGYCLRAWNGVLDFFQMVKDPSSDKLLPDPLPPPYVQPPYTLLIEITDVLLQPQWDLQSGWKFKKRPGIDYLLQQANRAGYEVVIFTKESATNAYPLLMQLDPQGLIWYRLFREDTRYISGVHIKDLSCINRPLEKVIHIDTDKQAYRLNPRNGLALPPWKGNDDDRVLYELVAFLHTISSNKVEDVRSVVSYYNQFDDPLSKFRENMVIAQKNQEEISQMKSEQRRFGGTGSIKLPTELKR